MRRACITRDSYTHHSVNYLRVYTVIGNLLIMLRYHPWSANTLLLVFKPPFKLYKSITQPRVVYGVLELTIDSLCSILRKLSAMEPS